MSINKKFKKQLVSMVKLDQQTRKKQWETHKELRNKFPNREDSGYKKEVGKLAKELMNIDRRHTNHMKKIIDKFGWPGKSLVGEYRANAAWLLVQHSDHDLKFQTKCLKLLKKALKQKNADPKHVAYLTDRILVHRGKKQIFGTQFVSDKFGSYGPSPIMDPRNLEKRRKKMNLEPFSEYKKKMEALQ